MSREQAPSSHEPPTLSIFKEGVPRRFEDGSFNDASVDKLALGILTGLRLVDAKQDAEFGEYKGNIVEALADCPHFRKPVLAAHQNGGIDGVKAAFDGLKMFNPAFTAVISEDTIEINHDGKLMEVVKKDIIEDQKKNQSTKQVQKGPTQLHPPIQNL